MNAAKSESGQRALAIGEDIGIAITPVLKFAPVEGNDRVIFWAAFVGSVYGQMAADIGREAAGVVIERATAILQNVRLDESSH